MQGSTIAQFGNADAKDDAEHLHGSLKTFGADTDVITSILCARSNAQVGQHSRDLRRKSRNLLESIKAGFRRLSNEF